MKRTFFLSLALIVATVSFGQMSQSEIADIINKSKEANEKNGVSNPDLIQPGQKLTFLFQDGTEKEIIVESGDTQWMILQTKVDSLMRSHGQVVQFPSSDSVSVVKKELPSITDAAGNNDFPWGLILALIALGIVGYGIFLFLKKRKEDREARIDPVTSGDPMRRGGVTDEQAAVYMQQVAERQFGAPNITVTNIVRGRLSGKNVAVFYAGQVTPQRRTFENIIAYRGTIQRGNTQEFVYFLQGCGNDVRVGNYFSGTDIQFIPEQEISTGGQENRQEQQPAGTPETTAPAEIVELTKAAQPIAQVLTNKNWGKLMIETDGKRIELNFGTEHKPKEAAAESLVNKQ